MAPDTLLVASAISVRFGGLHALDSVDLAVPAGEITGLIGPNGAGKTTMFNVLSGLIQPVNGRVHMDGHDITSWPTHRRGRAGMARTFQRLELFARMSVEDNLIAAWESSHPGAILGRGRSERRRRVAEVMELVGLRAIGRRVAGELPTGLGRMVELGRALCTDPKILLLDEPSSGLDLTETNRFSAVIRSLVRDHHGPLGILLVEHDMALVMEVCDSITVLDFGRRIAQGTPSEIRGDAAVRAAYLGDSDVA
ncbi:MAG TPA: ABC transporter ATP-binding protein [Acidimicrobiales bacterium]|nr:ABC transporter ATP-binding protein [Acidimicrobiales bacterium]